MTKRYGSEPSLAFTARPSRPTCLLVLHAFTVDVEDWYHDNTEPLSGPPQDRVERNTMHVLELMAAHGATGTFFCLGEVAKRHPGLIRRIAGAGHEIGSHGYHHRPVMELTHREFRTDVEHSLRILEDTTGRAVHGYRAPYFSIKAGVHWPIEILAELGLDYDASVLAIDRPPGLELVCPRAPFRHRNGMWEVPVAILPVLRFWHLPLASGAGLRILPESLFYRFVREFERVVGAGVFYLHPWELDVQSPTAVRFGSWFLRTGRDRLPKRLASLFAQRRFASILDVFADVRASVRTEGTK